LILRAEPGQTAFPKQYQLAERTEHGVLLHAKLPPESGGVLSRSRFAGTIADLVTWWKQPQL